ncbi:MAG: HD domain-containing protein, partial [Pseudomonadota bacterium]
APVEMMRIFRVAQIHGFDVHPNALRRIRGLLPKIAMLRADATANALFLEILAAREDPEAALRRMNEAGVLGRFIPEFGRVVAMAQFNMYHVYTVDEHSLFTVGNLHRIEVGKRADDLPLSTNMMPKIASRRALYVAAFLHDVMKGRAGDHSLLGEKAARRLCPRFGLTAEETETVAWLIRWHLQMSDTAFKRDVNDPATVEEFAGLVASPERLRLLLVLTVADIRAVGPHTWTTWKAQLLRRLYWNAEAALSEGFTDGDVERRVAAAKAAAQAAMAHLPEAAQVAALAGGANAYWLSFPPETHARHAALFIEAAQDDDPLLIDTQVDLSRGVTDVTVIAKDRPGLLPAISGGIAAMGADIVAARLFTTDDGLALDVFSVQEAGAAGAPGKLERRAGALREARWKPGPIERPDQLARLSLAVRRAVTEGDDLADALAGRRRATSKRAKVFGVAPRVLFDTDGSPRYTIVEVNGRDRPGFLHLVSKALNTQAVQIASAKITTFGEHAVDVFYVKDKFGHKITKRAQLAQIRDAVEDAIRADDIAMGFPAASSSAERRAAA